MNRLAFSSSLLAATAATSAPSVPSDAGEHNGIANIYVPGDFEAAFRIDATMTLPLASKNKSWYCIWFMLLEWPRPGEEPSFVQGGLMRWGDNGYNLSAFIATDEDRGNGVRYSDKALLSDGKHAVALSGDASTIVLEIDRKPLHSFQRGAYFKRERPLYIQVGAEAKQQGDTIVGTVEGLAVNRVLRDSRTSPPCTSNDRGLAFQIEPNGFKATGTFGSKDTTTFSECNEFISGYEALAKTRK